MVERRSASCYATDARDADIHRAWMRRGLPDDASEVARTLPSPTTRWT